jgi:ketosteroid isomerase-like protein
MKSVVFFSVILFSIIHAGCSGTAKEERSETVADNKNLERATQMFEAFNRHEWKTMTEFYSDNAVYLDPSYGRKPVPMSKDSIIKKYEGFASYIPNIKDSIITMLASGDKVLVEFVSVGNTVEGKRFELPISVVLTFKDSLIVQDNTYYDLE